VSDYLVLKRLTLKSDLGWFRDIFYGKALKGKQKSITLNKAVLNEIWPNLPIRQEAYETHKAAMDAAKALGPSGSATFQVESDQARAVGTLPIDLEVHGPGGKAPIVDDRIIALQDKNWRLNGDFVIPPDDDPQRFLSTMEEGDLALIGLDGVDWPTAAKVVLLAQSTSDAALMADLSPLVSKGARSMVQLDPATLQAIADKHSLPANHIIRNLISGATPPLVTSAFHLQLAPAAQPPIGLPPPAASVSTALAPPSLGATRVATKPVLRKPGAVRPVSASDHTERLAANTLTGFLGERMVNEYLASESAGGGPAYLWMWPTSAEHPYDFEVLAASGAVDHVIDAKATSLPWPTDFYMSSGELAYAAFSPVEYRIYRLSDVGLGKPATLRISDDIRPFAMTVAAAFTDAAIPGTKATGATISPNAPGLIWSAPITLPPVTT
jgi:hypothetical protein